MRWPAVCCAFCVLLPLGCGGGEAPKTAAAPPPNPKIEALIDELRSVGEPAAGAHPTAGSSVFMAIDEDPRFCGGIIGSKMPVVHPAMKKLVQEGLAATPTLIKHLSDDRETKLVIKHDGGMGGMWFATEYHPRHLDPAKAPEGINKEESHFDQMLPTYTVRVGDLCYVLLGQILNRSFNAVRYQPTLCIVLNSPVHSPELARAVEKEWAALTEAEHKAQLEEDAYSDTRDAGSALKRLLYYYPADGERVALRLLSRRFFNTSGVWPFVERKLMAVDDSGLWHQAVEQWSKQFGSDAVMLIPQIIHGRYLARNAEEVSAEARQRAKRLLETEFSNYDPYKPAFLGIAWFNEQTDLIDGISTFKDKRIDAAVQDLFERGVRVPVTGYDRGTKDLFALACAARMSGKGFDAGYRGYFKRRVKEIGVTPADSTERYQLEDINARLANLKG